MIVRVVAILAGVAAISWQPGAAWVERAYSNGGYPGWEHAAFAVTSRLPWSAGDIAALLGAAVIIWCVVIAVRAPRGQRLGAYASMVLSVAAVVGLYAVWFEVSWGWNYARAPIEARVRFDPRRITPQAADRLRGIAIANINRLASAAHAQANRPMNLDDLRDAWTPAVRAGGDTWYPQVGEAKP
ncbi:MAG TPA: DUF3810 family protein, partial [Candidatus Tumulicola sp.]